MLVVGAPVANRDWSLPRWFECLAAQTRRPDAFVFIHSGRPFDRTWKALEREASRHDFRVLVIRHDTRPPHPRHDNQRYETLADLRNEMIRIARDELAADLLLSLDTDIMLEHPGTVERLAALLDQGADLASPAAFLHPAASDPAEQVDVCWAYNAGWWRPDGTPGDPRRPWLRPAPSEIPWGDTVEIDVPMAVWLGNRDVMGCRYRWHESGEDLGFAQDLDDHHLRCVWDTGLRTRHIWCAEHLAPQQAEEGMAL